MLYLFVYFGGSLRLCLRRSTYQGNSRGSPLERRISRSIREDFLTLLVLAQARVGIARPLRLGRVRGDMQQETLREPKVVVAAPISPAVRYSPSANSPHMASQSQLSPYGVRPDLAREDMTAAIHSVPKVR